MAKTHDEIRERKNRNKRDYRERLRTGDQSKLQNYLQKDRERKVKERRALKATGLTKPQARALTKKAVSPG